VNEIFYDCPSQCIGNEKSDLTITSDTLMEMCRVSGTSDWPDAELDEEVHWHCLKGKFAAKTQEQKCISALLSSTSPSLPRQKLVLELLSD
jgi:hypothetical protein